jgi:hypothetical protein
MWVDIRKEGEVGLRPDSRAMEDWRAFGTVRYSSTSTLARSHHQLGEVIRTIRPDHSLHHRYSRHVTLCQHSCHQTLKDVISHPCLDPGPSRLHSLVRSSDLFLAAGYLAHRLESADTSGSQASNPPRIDIRADYTTAKAWESLSCFFPIAFLSIPSAAMRRLLPRGTLWPPWS